MTLGPRLQTVCSYAFENSCPDGVVGGVYFDEVFGDAKEVIIKNQAVIIRQNTTVNRIRIDKCGLLTVQGTESYFQLSLILKPMLHEPC